MHANILRLPDDIWESVLDALLGAGPAPPPCCAAPVLRRAAAALRSVCRAWRGARRPARRCFAQSLPTGLVVCGAHMRGEGALWRQIWAATGTCNANPFWVSTHESIDTAYRLQALARRHLPFMVMSGTAPSSRTPGVCVRVMNSDQWWSKWRAWRRREYNRHICEKRKTTRK